MGDEKSHHRRRLFCSFFRRPGMAEEEKGRKVDLCLIYASPGDSDLGRLTTLPRPYSLATHKPVKFPADCQEVLDSEFGTEEKSQTPNTKPEIPRVSQLHVQKSFHKHDEERIITAHSISIL